MKEERILNVIGKVDEKYIKEADPEAKAKRNAPVWTKWAAMAACLCLVAFGIVGVLKPFSLDDPGNLDGPVISENAEPDGVRCETKSGIYYFSFGVNINSKIAEEYIKSALEEIEANPDDLTIHLKYEGDEIVVILIDNNQGCELHRKTFPK